MALQLLTPFVAADLTSTLDSHSEEFCVLFLILGVKGDKLHILQWPTNPWSLSVVVWACYWPLTFLRYGDGESFAGLSPP
jgi:hypothetical protein